MEIGNGSNASTNSVFDIADAMHTSSNPSIIIANIIDLTP